MRMRRRLEQESFNFNPLWQVQTISQTIQLLLNAVEELIGYPVDLLSDLGADNELTAIAQAFFRDFFLMMRITTLLIRLSTQQHKLCFFFFDPIFFLWKTVNTRWELEMECHMVLLFRSAVKEGAQCSYRPMEYSFYEDWISSWHQ